MATMTQQLDPVADLEAAEAELALLRKLIGSRDANVTAHDLERAESAVGFARTRVEASAELEAEQREQARRDRVAEIRASLPAIFDTTKLDAAHRTLVDALDAYCKEAVPIQRGVSEVYEELIRMPPSGISVETSAWTGANIDGHRMPNFSGRVTTAVAEAFRRHGLRLEQGGR